MKDVMIDFETLGNGKNACVVQVGACYFDHKTGKAGITFQANIDAESAMNSGAEMDASTVYWWLSQSKEAINSILANPKEDIRTVFERLNDFLAPADRIWSHATFDFVILTETLKRLDMKPLFSYRAARDIRTVMDLANVSKKGLKREGVHHNGLDDAIFQASYVSAAIRALKKS